jgi:hypothetical protein
VECHVVRGGVTAVIGYAETMTSTPNHDQDAEPPTPDGEEPDTEQLDPDTAEPASDPDPEPGQDE